MLAQAYVLISELQKQINGNARLYLSVKDEVLILQCEWLEDGRLLKLEKGLSFIDLMKFREDEHLKMEFFIMKANHACRVKMGEMRMDA